MVDFTDVDPLKVNKAYRWQRINKLFNYTLLILILAVIGGVLVQTLNLNTQIHNQIAQNAVDRNNQLKAIQDQLNTIHTQSQQQRIAIANYDNCMTKAFIEHTAPTDCMVPK